jgi:DNA-binding NarL/FixJ family response regulator
MSPTPKARVLVVDDHEQVRDALKSIVDSQSDMTIVGEAADAAGTVAAICAQSPDIVLMDVSIPGSSGVALTRVITRDHPGVRIIGVSRHNEPAIANAMLQSGAGGYVLKQSASSALPAAIRAVARGEQYLDSSLHRSPAPAVSPRRQPAADAQPMTPQEEEVLRLVACSNTHQQIAQRLAISVEQAVTLKHIAMRKTHLASRVQVLDYARGRGWLSRLSR